MVRFCLIGAVFLFFMLSLSAQSAPCHLLDSTIQVPSGFGAAFNTQTSQKQLVMAADCSGFDNSQATYVYNKISEWVNNQWIPYALQGGRTDGQFIIGKGTLNRSVSAQQLKQPTYFIDFTCHWNKGKWNCGCPAASCTAHSWQVQGYKVQESGTPPPTPGTLQVSSDGHYLLRGDKPFFFLGDTAWTLMQLTNREDGDWYLKTRAEQGFTVVMATASMAHGVVGVTGSNKYGDKSFVGGNPANPLTTPGNNPANAQEYDYWDHVDYLIQRAKHHGLVVAFLPMFVGRNGVGFRNLNTGNAEAYGRFLGERYGKYDHIIWVLGGDNVPDGGEKTLWKNMARGITKAAVGSEDYSKIMMTYHITAVYSSSQYMHNENWLDFNMLQTWGNRDKIYPMVTTDFKKTPPKPTTMSEAAYEDGPQYQSAYKPIDAYAVRQQAYWSYFSGGNHIYGNTNVWNFNKYGRENTEPWKQAMTSEGAKDMTVVSHFFQSFDWWNMVPDQSVFASGGVSTYGKPLNLGMRSKTADTILIYLSARSTISVNLDKITSSRPATAKWVNPSNGSEASIGTVEKTGTRSFSTPGGWQDALLFIQAN